jgi:hypothetical protein
MAHDCSWAIESFEAALYALIESIAALTPTLECMHIHIHMAMACMVVESVLAVADIPFIKTPGREFGKSNIYRRRCAK